MKVAIIHEWLVNFRGSERVLLELCRIFPNATIYVSVLDRKYIPEELARRDIRTTFLQRLPFSTARYQWYLPLMPLAYESLDLSDYDLIISSSHACAKGVIPPPNALHICYCYTPMRYAWSGFHEYRRALTGRISRSLMSLLMHRLREWDLGTAKRVDEFVAISSEIKQRIRKYYRRPSTIIFPPVNSAMPDVSLLSSGVRDVLAKVNGQPFFLSLGRLVQYKRVDLAVDVCTEMGLPLIVAGAGPEVASLRRRAGPMVYFLEDFSDSDAAVLYNECRALLFPGHEDFGITMVEAQSHGKPVVAYGAGGALDIISDGTTGVLFWEQTPKALTDAILALERHQLSPAEIQESAKRFSSEAFHESLQRFVKNHYELERA